MARAIFAKTSKCLEGSSYIFEHPNNTRIWCRLGTYIRSFHAQVNQSTRRSIWLYPGTYLHFTQKVVDMPINEHTAQPVLKLSTCKQNTCTAQLMRFVLIRASRKWVEKRLNLCDLKNSCSSAKKSKFHKRFFLIKTMLSVIPLI